MLVVRNKDFIEAVVDGVMKKTTITHQGFLKIKKNYLKEVKKMTWEIRYYLTESAYKCGVVAYKETIKGNRNFAISWAQGKVKCSNYKFFDLVQK